MITYVNSKDAKLFELAAADLGVASLDIDQYLNSLAQLKAISPKYVRLPLYEEGHEDEEIFIIDANERSIKVPSSFSKNGVGVVSDELAETVWFRINRYFDIKDFGKAAGVVGEELKDGNLHILIQWEAPDGAKGASWAYAIDADTDKEYIYFGWALTAEHLTAKAGNIKFAVRIMQYDAAGDIAYSFATQSASVAVKAGLSFDLTDEGVKVESVADKIASRLMGGQIAHCPVFATNGDLPAYVLNLSVPEDLEEGAEEIPQAELKVVAAAPNGESYDAMAYKWYKKGANDEEFSQVEGAYSPALTVTSSGEYYVVVFGMKEIIDGSEYVYNASTGLASEQKFKYHTSVASSKSTVCEIPAPIALKISEEMAEKLVIKDGSALILVVERQKINNAIVGEVELKIEKTVNAIKDLDLETAEFSVVTGIPYEVDEEEIKVNMSSAAEGYYRITIINKLNGDQEETISTVICRVIKPADIASAQAVLLTQGGAASDASEGSVARGNKIEARVNILGLSDSLSIKWFKVVDQQDPADESADLEIAGAKELVYVPDDDGSYYFLATNKVEDTEKSVRSNLIVFNL